MESPKKLYIWVCLRPQQPSDNGFKNSFEYRTISEQFRGAKISAKPNGLLEPKLNLKAGQTTTTIIHHQPPPTFQRLPDIVVGLNMLFRILQDQKQGLRIKE